MLEGTPLLRQVFSPFGLSLSASFLGASPSTSLFLVRVPTQGYSSAQCLSNPPIHVSSGASSSCSFNATSAMDECRFEMSATSSGQFGVCWRGGGASTLLGLLRAVNTLDGCGNACPAFYSCSVPLLNTIDHTYGSCFGTCGDGVLTSWVSEGEGGRGGASTLSGRFRKRILQVGATTET